MVIIIKFAAKLKT